MTEVVAALIWDGDRFLACQRPAHKTRGLLWEFVGGKVEPGETKEQALIRECREELNITVKVGNVFMELIHEYPDMTVCLTLFNATISHGIPQKLEHNDIKWITTQQIDDYVFCPADVDILAQLKQIQNNTQAELFSLRDASYKKFHASLMPTVDPDNVFGVRMPVLRRYAKAFSKTDKVNAFLTTLPHRYYEENNLHGILISEIREYPEAVKALEEFLPHVNNWATCDLISPKAFYKHPDGLIDHVNRWITSNHCYTVRFAVCVFMKYYLDDCFKPEYLEMVASIVSDEYYVRMAIAWYFATALAKQYDAVIPYLENAILPVWTHNKTIQKAIESNRISDSQKAYLKTLKIKDGRNYEKN